MAGSFANAPAPTTLTSSGLLFQICINLQQFLGQHDGSIDGDRQSSVSTSDHDGDDDQL